MIGKAVAPIDIYGGPGKRIIFLINVIYLMLHAGFCVVYMHRASYRFCASVAGSLYIQQQPQGLFRGPQKIREAAAHYLLDLCSAIAIIAMHGKVLKKSMRNQNHDTKRRDHLLIRGSHYIRPRRSYIHRYFKL